MVVAAVVVEVVVMGAAVGVMGAAVVALATWLAPSKAACQA